MFAPMKTKVQPCFSFSAMSALIVSEVNSWLAFSWPSVTIIMTTGRPAASASVERMVRPIASYSGVEPRGM